MSGQKPQSAMEKGAKHPRDKWVIVRLGSKEGHRDENRWSGKRIEENTRGLKKTRVNAGRMADFRVYNGHVACDSMQGLTHSARGTDGPTQQYLCMHVCALYFMPL